MRPIALGERTERERENSEREDEDDGRKFFARPASPVCVKKKKQIPRERERNRRLKKKNKQRRKRLAVTELREKRNDRERVKLLNVQKNAQRCAGAIDRAELR